MAIPGAENISITKEIIDLIGIFIFRLYDIGNKADYFVGLTLCGISLFLLDFSDIL